MQGIKIILASILSFSTYMLGGFDMAIQVLTTMIVIDYATGLMKAFYNKNLSSYLGWKGILKKISMYLCIIVAVQVERLINQPDTIRNLIAFGFVANEGISIMENVAELGLDVPELKKYFKKFKERNGEDEDN